MMDWDRQISAYFDETLSAEETATLLDWVRSSPENLRRFTRAAYLHRALLDHYAARSQLQLHVSQDTYDSGGSSMADAMILPALSDEAQPAPPPAEPIPFVQLPARRQPAPRPAPVPPRRIHLWRYAAAILLVIAGFAVYLAWQPGRARTARLVAVDAPVWAPGAAAPAIGQPLPKDDFTLASGFAKIAFANGNEVIVQGPARFSVREDLDISLLEGRLAAVVTAQGRGLRVSTPEARVTDLGTEFGVHVVRGMTQVAVFKGRVTAAVPEAGSAQQEIGAGEGAQVSVHGVKQLPLAAVSSIFPRAMPAEMRRLSLVDLLAGGNGTGSAADIGIDVATGKFGPFDATGYRQGAQQYVRVEGHRVLDGCFIPGGTLPIDSAGHQFTFPMTNLTTYGLAWAGPSAPWAEEPPIVTTLPGEGFGRPSSQVLVLHSNSGFTIDLQAIRAMHGNAPLFAFRARVGNSFPNDASDAPPPLASVQVIVDGASRFEKHGFSNRNGPFDVVCPLTDNDRFLTLSTTDGGDGLGWDWILWTNPTLETRQAASPALPATQPPNQ